MGKGRLVLSALLQTPQDGALVCSSPILGLMVAPPQHSQAAPHHPLKKLSGSSGVLRIRLKLKYYSNHFAEREQEAISLIESGIMRF